MFPTISLSGTPQERGLRYGASASAQIRHSIGSYARLFAYCRGLDWSQMCGLASAYLPIVTKYAPGLVEEMRWIATGSGRTFEDILTLNVRTELLAGNLASGRHAAYEAVTARNQKLGVGVEAMHQPAPAARVLAAGLPQDGFASTQLNQPDRGECTTLVALPGASADGRAWLAQNWDWTGDQRAACVMLRVQTPGKPDMITLTEAGILAKIGMNSAGLGVTLNILSSKLDGQSEPGMPMHILLRMALETSGVDEAMACISQTPASASSCITVADATGRAVALEINPSGVHPMHPVDGILAHTNHCVTPGAAVAAPEIVASPSSIPRYNRAAALLRAHHGRIEHDTLAGILRDREGVPLCVCRYPDLSLHPCDQTEAVAATIMDLGGRIIYVAPDIPDQVPFEAMSVA